MYDDPQYFVLVTGAISPKFSSSYGVNQGCSLSPILSNIFQNDIHAIFQDCDPVKIGMSQEIAYCGPTIYCLYLVRRKAFNLVSTNSMIIVSHGVWLWMKQRKKHGVLQIKMVTGDFYLWWQDHWMCKIFSISYDMKMKLTLLDRRDKAMKMANMLLRAQRVYQIINEPFW